MEKPQNARAAGRRLVLLCGVAPALWTVALAIFTPSLFTQFDRRVYDGLLRSLPKSAPHRVAVIDIDERSVAAVGQWPWSRDVIARLVIGLRELGARVIAFDVVFPETDRFEGIDPSLFFDDDGHAWMVNNGAPEGKPLYSGHRAIWIQEFDWMI